MSSDGGNSTKDSGVTMPNEDVKNEVLETDL